jgi:hypothetical protein
VDYVKIENYPIKDLHENIKITNKKIFDNSDLNLLNKDFKPDLDKVNDKAFEEKEFLNSLERFVYKKLKLFNNKIRSISKNSGSFGKYVSVMSGKYITNMTQKKGLVEVNSVDVKNEESYKLVFVDYSKFKFIERSFVTIFETSTPFVREIGFARPEVLIIQFLSKLADFVCSDGLCLTNVDFLHFMSFFLELKKSENYVNFNIVIEEVVEKESISGVFMNKCYEREINLILFAKLLINLNKTTSYYYRFNNVLIERFLRNMAEYSVENFDNNIPKYMKKLMCFLLLNLSQKILIKRIRSVFESKKEKKTNRPPFSVNFDLVYLDDNKNKKDGKSKTKVVEEIKDKNKK